MQKDWQRNMLQIVTKTSHDRLTLTIKSTVKKSNIKLAWNRYSDTSSATQDIPPSEVRRATYAWSKIRSLPTSVSPNFGASLKTIEKYLTGAVTITEAIDRLVALSNDFTLAQLFTG